MPIPITCEYCEVSYRITDKAAGKRIRCKDCGEPIDVPEAANRRAASRPRRAEQRESRPRRTEQRESRPRPRSRDNAAPGSLIENRRERKYEDSGSKNLIIGIACGAIALLGGLGFLLYGRSDANESRTVETPPGIPANREELNAQLAESRRRSRALADQIQREGQATARNANPDNWQAPNIPPSAFSGRPGFGGPPPGFGASPRGQNRGAGNTDVAQNGDQAEKDPAAPNVGGTGRGGRSGFGAGRPNFGGRQRFGDVPGSGETDEELTQLEEAFLSGDTSARSRAITTLARSSRQERAAEILGKGLGQFDESRIINTIGRLGAAGEKVILNLIDQNPGDFRLRDCILALGQCGTDESLPVLAKLRSSSSPMVVSMARIAEVRINTRKRTGR